MMDLHARLVRQVATKIYGDREHSILIDAARCLEECEVRSSQAKLAREELASISNTLEKANRKYPELREVIESLEKITKKLGA